MQLAKFGLPKLAPRAASPGVTANCSKKKPAVDIALRREIARVDLVLALLGRWRLILELRKWPDQQLKNQATSHEFTGGYSRLARGSRESR